MAELVAVGPGPVRLAEGPLWDDARDVVWWVDVFGGVLHAFDPSTAQDRPYPLGARLASVAPDAGGALLVTADRDVVRFDPDTGARAVVAAVDRGDVLNDGACDPAGRYIVGTAVDEASAPGTAALYSVTATQFEVVLDGVTISNGLDWSPDGTTLYYVDTPTERIDAFDYDVATGALSSRRIFVDLHDVPGRPDGLCVDAAGGVWAAMAKGGAAVRRFDPDGSASAVVAVPVPNVTSVAFGGPDRRDLWITTSQLHMTPEDLAASPLSGRLFRLAAGDWTGQPITPFAG